jgi:alcohol dehydrogenase (NADP+)
VGHEIVGVAVKVGSKAEGGIKVGDRVGVGAQGDSCLGRFGDCDECSSGHENYCDKLVWTYSTSKAGMHLNGDKAQGGYATYHRAPSHFVVKIPENIESKVAAPLLCGGVTVFEPLKSAGVGKGVSVGVVGVGGLGHYAVMFAKAMGADKVVGISRKASKREEVLALGAHDYIATADDKDWTKKHYRSLDLIISTVASSKVNLEDLFEFTLS